MHDQTAATNRADRGRDDAVAAESRAEDTDMDMDIDITSTAARAATPETAVDGEGGEKEWDRPLELQGYLPYRLAVTYNLVSRVFANRCREVTGLSIPEWRVLAVLGRKAPLTSQDVAQRSTMDKAKVSRAVTSLVEKGLVNRDGDEHDHRLNRLSLTAEGAETYDALVPMALSLEAGLTDPLSEEEVEILNSLLDRLQEGARQLARG